MENIKASSIESHIIFKPKSCVHVISRYYLLLVLSMCLGAQIITVWRAYGKGSSLSLPVSSSEELCFSLAFACFVGQADTASGGDRMNPVREELQASTPQHTWPKPGPGMPSWAALAHIARGVPSPGAAVRSSSGSTLQASHLHSSAQHPSAIWWHLHLHPSLGIMKIQAFVLLQHLSSMNVLTFMYHQETLCYVRILFLWHYLP